MINDTTISLLDEIDDSSLDAEFHVIESFIDLYDKYSGLYDNSDSFEVFTESAKKKEDKSIGEQLKDASKKDSNKLVTAIAFIPRLIGILAKSITSKLAKTGIGKAFKSLSDYFKNCKAEDEKRERVKQLNEAMKKSGKNFEFYYDEIKGKIRIKKSGTRFLMLLGWLNALVLTTYALVKKLYKIKKGDNDSLSRLKDDFKHLLKKSENQDKLDPHDVIDDSIDSIATTFGVITNIGAELGVLAAGAHGLFEYKTMQKLTKDDPEVAEKDAAFYRNLADTSSYMTKIIAIITGTIGSLGVITKWGEIIQDINDKLKERADDNKIILDRLDKKGYNNESMSPAEREKLYAEERSHIIADKERATKEILEEKGKEDTPANRVKYVPVGEIEDKMEEYLKEEREKLDKTRASWRNKDSK